MIEDFIVPEGTKMNIDWDAFRRLAAKDFLSAMLQGGVDGTLGMLASSAVTAADELIKQLKEEK